MKNFKLFLESSEMEKLFQQVEINRNITIRTWVDNIKTKVINGDVRIETVDFGDLSDIDLNGILVIANTEITSFNNFPKTVEKIIWDGVRVENFENSPKMKSFKFQYGKLTSFEYVPDTVIEVDCSFNDIYSFKFLPQNVKSINCTYCKFTSFEHLPNSIKEIKCLHNNITSFKYLPINVEVIDCSLNKITSLEYLPMNIIKANLRDNPIHKLYEDYDYDSKNIDLLYLLHYLKLDSKIHTTEDIHPILELGKYDFKDFRAIVESLDINLVTHTTQEILDILSSL